MVTRELTHEEAAGLETQREWVRALLKGFGSDVRLTASVDDIPTLHSLISEGPYTSDASSELFVFGVVFGDILAHELDLEWVVVEDEQGVDFALLARQSSVCVFPCDMLLKRIEAGEQADSIDLAALMEGIRKNVDA
jgi:hypothetical protein